MSRRIDGQEIRDAVKAAGADWKLTDYGDSDAFRSMVGLSLGSETPQLLVPASRAALEFKAPTSRIDSIGVDIRAGIGRGRQSSRQLHELHGLRRDGRHGGGDPDPLGLVSEPGAVRAD